MIGAIVQAIDHAMQRAHDGAGAGIKVANSQHGGGAPISNMDSGAGEAAKQDLGNQQETTPEQNEAAEKAKIGSDSTPIGTNAGTNASEAAPASIGAEAGAGEQASEGAGESTEGIAGAGAEGAGVASSILSDENAKTSKPVSKLQLVRAYGANAGKGFANAGAIATGGSKAAEWENIDNSFARKAAEDTVKSWRNKNFNSDSTNK